MIEDCLAALRARRHYSESSLILTASWLEHCRRFHEPKSLLVLKPQELAEWQQSLSWTPGPSGKLYAENTMNQAVGAIRLFYRWALTVGLVADDSSKGLRTRRVPQRTRSLEGNIKGLLAMLIGDEPVSIRDRAFLGLIFETGIPIKACARLDLKSLQTDTGALLAGGKRAGIYSLSQGLTDDLERYLQHARPFLGSTSRGEQALFLNSKGRRMSDVTMRFRLRSYSRKLAKP